MQDSRGAQAFRSGRRASQLQHGGADARGNGFDVESGGARARGASRRSAPRSHHAEREPHRGGGPVARAPRPRPSRDRVRARGGAWLRRRCPRDPASLRGAIERPPRHRAGARPAPRDAPRALRRGLDRRPLSRHRRPRVRCRHPGQRVDRAGFHRRPAHAPLPLTRGGRSLVSRAAEAARSSPKRICSRTSASTIASRRPARSPAGSFSAAEGRSRLR